MRDLKKRLSIFGALVFSLALAAMPSLVLAREVNSNPSVADAVSFHGGAPQCYSGGYVSGCEVAVDNTGNFVPTVNNAQNLGSASLQWAASYTVNETVSGTQSVGTAGTSTLLTPGTAATVNSTIGLFAIPSVSLGSSGQNFGVNKSTIIPVNSSYELLTSTGGPIVMASLPNISTTTVVGGSTLLTDGTFLVLTSTISSATAGITFQSNGALAGSQLFLGAATRQIGLHKVLTLKFHAVSGAASYWEEIAYTDGNN